MQNSHVRAVVLVSKFLILLLPTNFIKTTNIKSKKKLHRVYPKFYKPKLLNSKN